jgi:hypothetical protein
MLAKAAARWRLVRELEGWTDEDGGDIEHDVLDIIEGRLAADVTAGENPLPKHRRRED